MDDEKVQAKYDYQAAESKFFKICFLTKISIISKVLNENIDKIKNPALKIKIQEVINLINPILKTRKLKDDHLVALLQYLELSKEIETA